MFTEDSKAEAWYEEQQRLKKEAEAAADQATASSLERTLSSPLLNSIAGAANGPRRCTGDPRCRVGTPDQWKSG